MRPLSRVRRAPESPGSPGCRTALWVASRGAATRRRPIYDSLRYSEPSRNEEGEPNECRDPGHVASDVRQAQGTCRGFVDENRPDLRGIDAHRRIRGPERGRQIGHHRIHCAFRAPVVRLDTRRHIAFRGRSPGVPGIRTTAGAPGHRAAVAAAVHFASACASCGTRARRWARRTTPLRGELLFVVSPHLMDYFDQMAQVITQAYLDEQYRQARWRESLRHQLHEVVFSHSTDDEAFQTTVKALGLDPIAARIAIAVEMEQFDRNELTSDGRLDRLVLSAAGTSRYPPGSSRQRMASRPIDHLDPVRARRGDERERQAIGATRRGPRRVAFRHQGRRGRTRRYRCKGMGDVGRGSDPGAGFGTGHRFEAPAGPLLFGHHDRGERTQGRRRIALPAVADRSGVGRTRSSADASGVLLQQAAEKGDGSCARHPSEHAGTIGLSASTTCWVHRWTKPGGSRSSRSPSHCTSGASSTGPHATPGSSTSPAPPGSDPEGGAAGQPNRAFGLRARRLDCVAIVSNVTWRRDDDVEP